VTITVIDRLYTKFGRVDCDVLANLTPVATQLGDALTALAAAITLRARVAARVPARTLIGQINRGRLVVPAAPG
jgi:hypothetical protein